jgi:hypothetical protein
MLRASPQRDVARSRNGSNFSPLRGLFIPRREDGKMKTMIIALSAAALIAAAPAVLAQGVPSKTPGLQHKVAKKHHPSGYAPLREMQAKGPNKSYPGTFGYVPGEPRGLDRDLESSRHAGGGGGGGGGGGSGM